MQVVEKSKEEHANELEEIESLIVRLKKAKNRVEKRRLLAQFNSKQAQIWGAQRQFTSVVPFNQGDNDLVWNQKVHAFVDRQLYEDALATQDPTRSNYRGVSPNFGGGTIEEGRGIGTSVKRMKKLTTVLSKN